MKPMHILLILFLAVGCKQKKEDVVVEDTSSETSPTPPPVEVVAKAKYLYLTTGVCYAGSNSTFTAATSSNLIYRLHLDSAQKDVVIADYLAAPANPGDSPISVVDADADHLWILVESASGRRIEKVAKTGNNGRQIFSTNTTVLSAALKAMVKTADGGILISKGASVERLTGQGMRMGAPYIGTNLGATCGTAITNISSLATTTSGKVLYTHAATGQNRWGVIGANGYTTAADCLAAQASPDPAAFPTAIKFIESANQVLVAYTGNSINPNLNSIYVYDLNDTTGAISAGTKIYDANTYVATGYLLYGISAMAFDPDTNSLYVSTAVSNATTVVNYQIEKLTYNPSSKTLARASNMPFYPYGNDTKCVSSLSINE